MLDIIIDLMKSFSKKKKAFISLLLAVAMVITPLPAGGFMMEVEASNHEMPDDPGQGDKGKSDLTAYTWKNANGASEPSAHGSSSGATYRFDLVGITDPNHNYSDKDIQTTYHYAGYPNFIGIAEAGAEDKAGTVPKVEYKGITDNTDGCNGIVKTVTIDGVTLEYRVKLSASKDGQYILADYSIKDIYGTNQGGVGKDGRVVFMGAGADVMIKGDDDADVEVTPLGFRMVNRYDKRSFNCITNDPLNLGTNKPTYRWAGYPYHAFTKWMFDPRSDIDNSSTGHYDKSYTGGDDSGFSYGWRFMLRPYERVDKRVAYAIRDTAYYVNYAWTGSSDGTNTNPFKNIETALNKLKNNHGGNGIIYIQSCNKADILKNSSNKKSFEIGRGFKNITIASADYGLDSNVPFNDIVDLQKLSDEPLFKISDSARVSFSKIKLDGGKTESKKPLIDVGGSAKLYLNGDKVEVKNAVLTGDSKTGVINVRDSALLNIAGAKINSNTVNGENQAAIYFNGSDFEIKYDFDVTGNKTKDGKPSNIYLEAGKFMKAIDEIDGSKAGVKIASIPETPVVIVKDGKTEGNIATPYADRFTSDQGYDVSVDKTDNKNIVLSTKKVNIDLKYNNSLTGAEIPEADIIDKPADTQLTAVKGKEIDIKVPDVNLFTFDPDKSVCSSTALTIVKENAEYHIKGTMGEENVIVSLKYKPVSSEIAFDTVGGLPRTIPSFKGNAGEAINRPLPTASKDGFIFEGWFEGSKDSSGNITYGAKCNALPEKYAEGRKEYFAKWSPDTSIEFNLSAAYKNENEDIIFKEYNPLAKVSNYSETAVGYKNVPSYIYARSYALPGEFIDIDGQKKVVGAWDSTGVGSFKIPNMPGMDLTANILYKVDRSSEDNKNIFRVERCLEGKEDRPFKVEENKFFPEDDISSNKADLFGYTYVTVKKVIGFTNGDDENHKTSDDVLYSSVDSTDSNFDVTDGTFTGKMPNRPVTIRYIYTSDGIGYNYEFTRKDLDGGDRSEFIERIKDKVNSDEPLPRNEEEGNPNKYGYTYQAGPSIDPSEGFTINGDHTYEGAMPANDLSIGYEYHRDLSKWKDINFGVAKDKKNKLHGKLKRDNCSDELTLISNTEAKATILCDDEALDSNKGFTWGFMKEGKPEDNRLPSIVPAFEADRYYEFDFWFIDENDNGQFDENEEKITDEKTFKKTDLDHKILAEVKEKDGEWIDITLEHDDHCTFTNTAQSVNVHIPFDKTWGDVSLYADPMPLVEADPNNNFKFKAWYCGNEVINNTTELENGNLYRLRFTADQEEFYGDDDGQGNLDANGRLDINGKGVADVYNTSRNSKYILTDLDGKIIDSKDGDISGRLHFEGLYPENRYMVYEVDKDFDMTGKKNISEISPVIDEEEVLIPVLDENYQVSYDEKNQGKTMIEIDPADKDSQYALLDEDGNTVYDWTNPSKGKVIFRDLDKDKEYKVIARPKNSDYSISERTDDAYTVVTDPVGNIEIPAYVLEVRNGSQTENSPVEKGVEVELSPNNETDFLYWKVLIGKIPGEGTIIKTKNLKFEMPDNNILIEAVNKKAPSENADVTTEVKGGNKNKVSLDPDAITELEESFTTDKDKELMSENNADVEYRIIYKKGKVKSVEEELAKDTSEFIDHEAAMRGAFGLDIDLERYVNGRKAKFASSSNARPQCDDFTTFVQLDDSVVDMLDYTLYEYKVASGSEAERLEKIPMSPVPDDNGGFLGFFANVFKRYVLMYSKAYNVTIKDEAKAPNNFGMVSFKVRHGEAIDEYREYTSLDMPINSFDYKDGYHYEFEGWSTSHDSFREYDVSKDVKKNTIIYAYYKCNKKETDKARKELEDLLALKRKEADDVFLKNNEYIEYQEAIKRADEIINRPASAPNGRASIEEILAAIENLEQDTKDIDEKLDHRHNDYHDKVENNHTSGGSGGGGGGRGGRVISEPFKPQLSDYNVQDVFRAELNPHYEVGTNGNWDIIDPSAHKWKFVLNGGIALENKWALLNWTEGGVSKKAWYHFGGDGIMDSGWLRDEYGVWYYLSEVHDGYFGKMQTGWYLDNTDGHWYYFDPATGAMLTGWQLVDGKWYYFAPGTSVNYEFNVRTGKWDYVGNEQQIPYGSMYVNRKSEDGYTLGNDGSWIK